MNLNTKNPEEIPGTLREAALRLSARGKTETAATLHEAAGKITAVLAEASLSRVYQHVKENEFVVLTAWKKEIDGKPVDRATNEKNMLELAQKIRHAGLGYTRAEGRGQEEKTNPETGEKKIEPTTEPSLIVVNKVSGKPKNPEKPHLEKEPSSAVPNFKQWAVDLVKPYSQTGILYHHPEHGTEILKADGSTDVKFSRFAAGAAEFFTKVGSKRLIPTDPVDKSKNKVKGNGRVGQSEKPFHFEHYDFLGLKFSSPPGNTLEGMGWQAQGQRGPYEGESSYRTGQEFALKPVSGLLDDLKAILDA